MIDKTHAAVEQNRAQEAGKPCTRSAGNRPGAAALHTALFAAWFGVALGWPGGLRAQGINAAPPDPATVDAELTAALVNRVETARKSVGIIVGIVTPEGRRYLDRGVSDQTGHAALTPQTLFEIGSITKVFTSILLADMVERGDMQLADPIARHLGDTVKVPQRNGKLITLVDLATHRSGLPRLPANLDVAKNLGNPYAAYGPEQLEAFLAGYELPRDPGAEWEYSNLGAGLLGHVLARRGGMSYEQLVRSRIFEPLGMTDTTITLSAEQRRRLATGHGIVGQPTEPWDFDALAGAGAIRSTPADMLTFAAAQLGLFKHPLETAMQRVLEVDLAGGGPGTRQHLGWLKIGGTVLFHNGGTGGYRSALAVRPGTRQAVVVLSNSMQDVDDIALHGVVPEQPLKTFDAPPPRQQIQLAEATLETYVGDYEVSPQVSIAVTREGGRLFVQATGHPKSELLAEREDVFFDASNPDATISFVKDGATTTQLTLRLKGVDFPARRREK